MVVGLTGVSVQVAAFKVGNVTVLIQRMVDYLALVKLNEPAQQKLLKCWAAGATHVSSNCKCSCRYSSVTCLWCRGSGVLFTVKVRKLL